MSDFGIGVVAVCVLLIFVILLGIFSDWYRFDDQHQLPRPHRPAHPACVYQPPGRC